MKRNDISEELSQLAFDFFYMFARFEFGLKENRYLQDCTPGVPALPGWHKFATQWHMAYRVSTEAEHLMHAPPTRQVVGNDHDFQWAEVDLTNWPGQLGKVIRLTQIVRNNLFHGGKHSADGWDDPERTETLLRLGTAVLNQIAEQTGLEVD